MRDKRVKAWFSCGVTSAIACALSIKEFGKDNVDLVYQHINTAHPDNERFINDFENWQGVKIEVIKSDKYKDQFDVIDKTGYVNGPGGARCTLELKKNVRYKYEENNPFSAQIFGFEFAKKEINRAIRFYQQYPYAKSRFPLIEQMITKENATSMLMRAGIDIPIMYKMGYTNNNCIGCVKGGMGYWNKIRKDFPDIFEQMALAERKAGFSCITDVFLDELKPTRGRPLKPIVPDCGSFCEIEFAYIMDDRVDLILKGQISMTELYV